MEEPDEGVSSKAFETLAAVVGDIKRGVHVVNKKVSEIPTDI